MSHEWMLQCAVLYLPVVLTAVLLGCVQAESLHPASLLMSLAWQAAVLPVADWCCQRLGCWSYLASPWRMLEMPLAPHLGWVVWWGATIPLLFELLMRRLRADVACVVTVVLALGLDLWMMPLLSPMLLLSPKWIGGEAIMCVFALLPGMGLQQMVRRKCWPLCRGMMIALAFALLVLWILPVSTLRQMPCFTAERWLVLLAGLAFTITPGLWAVILFGTKGQGTPIPFDPPQHLVTSGIYRWIANPMQTSIFLSMLLVSWFLQHQGLAIAAISTWVYCIGIARWSENIDLTERFGQRWLEYRRKTPNWWPRRHSRKR